MSKTGFSHKDWVNEYPGSASIDDLAVPFKGYVRSFVDALKAANILPSIASTYRPPQRAYLMHVSWKIANKKIKPSEAPGYSGGGIDITWKHTDDLDDAKSIKAAEDMCKAFGITHLKVAPSLTSRHTEKNAIDMSFSWSGDLTIKNAKGEDVVIKTTPRTGMNKELHAVAETYNVIKFKGGDADQPHWSTDGS
ncbi:hypothetical protein HZU77_007675 [Neisseriaceae bacterium TC5R-5]|nr:hypothetical protein [Neisseriaceae bacterium TC5R-5]